MTKITTYRQLIMMLLAGPEDKMDEPCSECQAGSMFCYWPKISVWFRTVMNGHPQCLTAIIKSESRVDVNAKDPLNNSALIYAAAGGHDECVNILISEGADVNLVGSEGETALVKAFIHSQHDTQDTFDSAITSADSCQKHCVEPTVGSRS